MNRDDEFHVTVTTDGDDAIVS
ncbi:MAG: hypothetical protein QOG30_2759, partial [Acidimicrobiaceae bacterium]